MLGNSVMAVWNRCERSVSRHSIFANARHVPPMEAQALEGLGLQQLVRRIHVCNFAIELGQFKTKAGADRPVFILIWCAYLRATRWRDKYDLIFALNYVERSAVTIEPIRALAAQT
jgi:hypothetical protein